MNSMFNATTVNGFMERLGRITIDAKPTWGRMNVAQMLEHCSAPIAIALGDVDTPQSIPGFLFGKIAKPMLTDGLPFKRYLPTDRTFLIPATTDFDDAKRRLTLLMGRLSTTAPENIHLRLHPFFGKLSSHEWDMATVKHLDHHFKQFGV